MIFQNRSFLSTWTFWYINIKKKSFANITCYTLSSVIMTTYLAQCKHYQWFHFGTEFWILPRIMTSGGSATGHGGAGSDGSLQPGFSEGRCSAEPSTRCAQGLWLPRHRALDFFFFFYWKCLPCVLFPDAAHYTTVSIACCSTDFLGRKHWGKSGFLSAWTQVPLTQTVLEFANYILMPVTMRDIWNMNCCSYQCQEN